MDNEPANKIETRDFVPKILHRGIWADKLKNDQDILVGGNMFSSNLTTELKLDFDSFDPQLMQFNNKTIEELWENDKDKVTEWLKQVGSDIDPFLFYKCYQVQMATQRVLKVDLSRDSVPERIHIYNEKGVPKLSNLVGKSACAEISAMGQNLFQKIGIESTYTSGVTMADANSDEEYPDNHSFLVLPNNEETYIFDIARPKSGINMPRLLKTAVPYNYELLKDKSELLVEAKDVLQDKTLWYGVGEPVSGLHNKIEFEK